MPDPSEERREFLKLCGLAAMGLVSTAVPSWLFAVADLVSKRRDKTVIVLFQRGAADGLNMVVPFRDKDYYTLRPSIAIKQPGQAHGALDLDGQFGLHPALAPLLPLFRSKQMAIIHAAGSHDPTRSHFEAQDNMETGTPGVKITADGWLNRALSAQPFKNRDPLSALALSQRLPRALRGKYPVATMNSMEAYRFLGGSGPQDKFEKMYGESADKLLAGSAQAASRSVDALRDVLKEQPENALAGYDKSRASRGLSQLARVIKARRGLRAGFIDLGGWDHHANEGAHDGQLNARLGEMGAGIAAFYRDLGDQAGDVVLLTMTEFGRTAQENGDRGTDHGHGSVMTVIGGDVRGGKVYGRWPGLSKEALFEGRDLAVTTDFRQVLSEVLSHQLGLKDPTIFPGFKAGTPLGLW